MKGRAEGHVIFNEWHNIYIHVLDGSSGNAMHRIYRPIVQRLSDGAIGLVRTAWLNALVLEGNIAFYEFFMNFSQAKRNFIYFKEKQNKMNRWINPFGDLTGIFRVN